jgi:CheY-like chemotaxis protein
MSAKIMLVEDDTNLSDIYRARLEAEGYQIVAAPDGEDALAMAVKEHPDLIISDVMMPKISGFDMLDILRSTNGIKQTRVIMMTALSQAEDQERAKKLGADRYLVKSQVTLEDVVKTVHEVLEDAPVEPETPPPAAVAIPATPVAQPVTPSPMQVSPTPPPVVEEPAAQAEPIIAPTPAATSMTAIPAENDAAATEPNTPPIEPVMIPAPAFMQPPAPTRDEPPPVVLMPPPIDEVSATDDPLTSSAPIIKPTSAKSITVVDDDEGAQAPTEALGETTPQTPDLDGGDTVVAPQAEDTTAPEGKVSISPAYPAEITDATPTPESAPEESTVSPPEDTADPVGETASAEQTQPAEEPPATTEESVSPAADSTSETDSEPTADDSTESVPATETTTAPDDLSQTMTAEKSTVMDQIQDFVDEEEAETAKQKNATVEDGKESKEEVPATKIFTNPGSALDDPILPDPDYIPSGSQKTMPGKKLDGETDDTDSTGGGNDFMHIANKKVIEPLNASFNKKPDINQLLAEENASTTNEAPAPDYVASPSVTPDQQPIPDQSAADPNNIAL